jgi:hypothetical protein
LAPLDFAKNEMAKSPNKFLQQQIQVYPFTNEEKLAIAKHAFGMMSPRRAAKYLPNFGLEEAERMDLMLHIAAERDVWTAVDIGRRSSLGQEGFAQLGHALLDSRHSNQLPHFIEAVGLEDETTRYKLAQGMAEKNPARLLALIAKFNLPSSRHAELALLAVEHLPPDTTLDPEILSDFDIPDQKARIALFSLLAEKAPDVCVTSLKKLPLHDEKEQIRLAEKIGKKDPALLLHHIEEFGIADDTARQNLFFAHFKSAMRMTLDRTKPEHASKNQSLIKAAKALHAKLDNFFGDDLSLPNFSRHAAELGIHDPAIAILLDQVRQHPDLELRKVIGEWALYSALRLADTHVSDSPPARAAFESTLDAIKSWQEPEARYSLTDKLAECLETDSDVSRQKFVDISRDLANSHTRVFRPLLRGLAKDDGQPDPLLGQLIPFLSSANFRDTERCKSVVHGLLGLTQSTRISLDDKRALLQAVLPQTGGKAPTAAFAKAMHGLGNLMSLSMHSNADIRRNVFLSLRGIQRAAAPNIAADKINIALGDIFFDVLGRKPATEEAKKHFMEKMDEYNAKARYPNAIMLYAIPLFLHLKDGEEKENIFKVLNNFIDDVVLSPDPKAAFLKRRNDLSASQHLKEAYAIDPTATTAWLNYEEEISLGELLPNGKAQAQKKEKDFSKWKLEFKNNPEDYLLCGTEGRAKCQAIQAPPVKNKALMGYVTQGKYRILTLKSPNGVIQARATARLGIDPKGKGLVMHIETPYAGPGVPDECNKILLDFAKKMARQIGVPLITHSEKFPGSESYPNPIHFYPDTAACEYVDSHTAGVMSSRKGYVLKRAKIIDLSEA